MVKFTKPNVPRSVRPTQRRHCHESPLPTDSESLLKSLLTDLLDPFGLKKMPDKQFGLDSPGVDHSVARCVGRESMKSL